jgi:caa(3)-type oxidase subunit IV
MSAQPSQIHPAPRRATYAIVFVILAVLTGIEIALSLLGVDPSLRTPAFLALSLAKAALVVSFYMHLRHDSRLYAFIFIVPVILFALFAGVMLIP